MDHIGFEVRGLEEFVKKLEAQGIKLDRPYAPVPALGISIAFITDPWGTYIELTEGLSKVPRSSKVKTQKSKVELQSCQVG